MELDNNISLIGNIEDLMGSDYEPRSKQSAILMSTYRTSSPQERKKIDNCFIALCGYSLKTLMAEMGELVA
jgi:hypothetical protein